MTGTIPADAGFAIREAALAQAAELARQGRYAQARGTLEQAWREAEPTAAYLDLLARIHAQQGDLDAADDCWARAQRLQPGEEEYAAARRRVARMRGRRTVSIPGVLRALAFLVVSAVVIALLAAIRSDVSATHRDQRNLARRIEPVTRPSPPPVDVLADVARQVRLPGVRVRRLPGEVAITFRSGLFRDGTRLTPGGRATAERLGARLRAYANRVAVAVVGHTDSVAAAGGTSNVDLGTARAVVVRELLRQASGIPTVRFSVSSAGSALAPYKGDSARNRTVSVRISTAP